MTNRITMRIALLRQMDKAGILEYQDVAAKAGVCKPSIVYLSSSTKVSTLMKVAGALGCQPADLLEGLKAHKPERTLE